MDLGAWISSLRIASKTWWADLPPRIRAKVSMETVRRAYNGEPISRAKAEPIVEATKGKVELWRLILGSELEKQARADILREHATGPPHPRLIVGGQGDREGTKGEPSPSRGARRQSNHPPPPEE